MWTCYCCKKDLPDRAIEHKAMTEDGEEVSVGSDCIKKIIEAGTDGYQKEESCVEPLYSLSAWGMIGDVVDDTEMDRYRRGMRP